MAGFGGRRLLWLLIASWGAWSFLEVTVVLPFTFLLGRPLVNDLGSWRWGLLLDTLTKALCLAASISAKGKRRMLDNQMKRRQQGERSKGVRTYVDGSMCLVYRLQESSQDHHSKRATCQGRSGPCTSIHQKGSQAPNGWKPSTRRLYADER